MTEADRRHEQQLRAQVKVTGGDHRAQCVVLADFYEQHGQLSRAALWRTKSLLKGSHAPPADLVVRDAKWRRKVMMWLLSHLMGPAAVSRAFKSSPSWTGALIRDVAQKICLAANAERHYPTLAATQRLQAVGALPKPFEWSAFELGEMPPDSWPVTRDERAKPPKKKLTETDLHRLALRHETDKRFVAATGYHPALDPSDRQDATLIPIWNDIYKKVRAESILMQSFICRACSAVHDRWSARCPSCNSLVGLTAEAQATPDEETRNQEI